MSRNVTAQELAQKISTFINGASSDDIESLAQEMVYDHRTLQQRTFSLFLCYCLKMKQNDFDLRNEASRNIAKKLMDERGDMWKLPNI